ncbi:MAG: flagellar hook-length control protein FliK [Armatimonadota bacterium]
MRLPRLADLSGQGATQRVRIEVDPPELGRCELELTLREGAVRAVLIAERPETVVVLRQAEGQVRAALAEQDLRMAQFDVRQGAGGASAQGGDGGREAPRWAATMPAPEAAERRAHRPSARRWGTARHVDLVG